MSKIKVKGNKGVFKEGMFKGKEFAHSDEIEHFCKNVLDNTFDMWMVVGRDKDDSDKGKELASGDVVKGLAVGKLGKGDTDDRKSSLAMMILDVVDTVCDTDDEIANFLDALALTAKQMSKLKRGEGLDSSAEKAKEVVKLDILKGLWDTAVSSFSDYAGKEFYIRSCLQTAVIARVLSEGDAKAKERMRKSMRAEMLGAGDSSASRSSAEGIDKFVEIVLDLIDKDMPASAILSALEKYKDSLT